jgi:hypothetical protein
MPDSPCPQAAATFTTLPPPPDAMLFAVEREVPEVRVPPPPIGVAEVVAIDPARRWPYHGPAFNALDVMWWSMLARAVYWGDETWVRNVAAWAGPVIQLDFYRGSDFAQGRAFVELQDCMLCIVRGTTNELERLQYIVSHTADSMHEDLVHDWEINSTWYDRGNAIYHDFFTFGAVNKPQIYLGHSSGGAYAGYVAFALAQPSPANLGSVCTFGTPKWATGSMFNFSYSLGKHRPQGINFTMAGDPVPLLPPPFAVLDAVRQVYPLAPRPSYMHYENLLMFRPFGGYDLVQSEPTTQYITNRTAQLLNGTINLAQHGYDRYTSTAQAWAIADSFAGVYDRAAYSALAVILEAMIAAGA